MVNRMMQTPPAAAGQASRSTRDSELRVQDQPQNQTSPNQDPIIQVEGLRKTYKTARGSLDLFDNLDLKIAPGEMVAIVGQSGAGKSTLLHILGALDTPSAGTVYCASTNVASLSRARQRPFAIGKSGTFGSSITCCRSLQHWKTLQCR